ncbi:hypothetical protein CLI64_25635 [Nostoc sp. CENA543]|nr:hypothetical protein CLI64_25635 [Nostoc sp. CENA543]
MSIKSIFITVICVLALTIVLAFSDYPHQGDAIIVPQAVKAAFKAKYSQIPHSWQRHEYGYEAIFIKDNIKYEAEFSQTGEWLETEQYAQAKDFPPLILNRIQQERPQFTITKYEIEITPQGIFYEVDITDGETEEELYFDSKGNPQIDLYED